MSNPAVPEPARSLGRRSFLRTSALVVGATAVSGGLLAGCTTVAKSDTPTSGAVAGAASGAAANSSAYVDAIRALVAGRTLQVGFTPPILSEFFNQMENAAFGKMAELEELYGVQWKWERSAPTANFDAVEQQVKIVQNWGAQKFDAVAVCTGANFATMQGVYEQVSSGGTSVFQFNQPVELYDPNLIQTVSNVGYDNRWQSGYLAGTFIAKTLGGQGKVIAIMGPAGSDWSKARQIGFDQALKENPGLQVVGTADGGYVRDKGYNAARDLLTANPDINAIYGENEDMALGASQAVDSQGLKQWDGSSGIVIIGADGLLSGMEAIKTGKLTASIDVGSVDQGRQLIEAIFQSLVLGDTVGKTILVPTRVVTKTNVASAEAYIQGAQTPPKKY